MHMNVFVAHFAIHKKLFFRKSNQGFSFVGNSRLHVQVRNLTDARYIF